MGFPDRSRFAARLVMESLEDRTTPAALDPAPAVALPELVAGEVIGDRINVVMQTATNNETDRAALAATPFAESVTSLGFGIYSVTLTATSDTTSAVEFYGSLRGVRSAEPDQLVGVSLTPNDPSYPVQYSLNNTGQSGGTPDADIDAPEAWDSTTGRAAFVVGVIDTGIDYTHPDLYLNVWINQSEIPSGVRSLLTDTDGDAVITFRDLNFRDANGVLVNVGPGKITDLNANGRIDGGDLLRTAATGGWANGSDGGANGYIDDLVGWDFVNNDNNPFDDNSHGTHVSGTIGAIGNNGVGVAGVNWAVSIAGLKFLDANGSGSTSGALAALNYAVAAGIKVSNNSWGGGGFSSAMSTAINNAQAAGHIFVAAAGNANSNNDTVANYPSNYNVNNVVAVASTTRTDVRSSFSNYGATTVDLAAPGSSILSTTPNNTYSTFSGTSMATPHVAGAIALYWGKSGNQNLTSTQVIQNLYSSADVLPSLSGLVANGRRLNVARLLGNSTPAPAPAPKVQSAVPNGTTGVNITGFRVTFDRAIDAGTFTTLDVTSATGPGGAIAISAVNAVSSTVFDITFVTAQTTAGNYAVTFGPNITSGGTQMDGNGDGVAGDAYTATSSLVTTITRTYTNNTQFGIRDFATTVSTINVTDNFTVTDLNVRVTLTHTWVSDLTITLTAPNGQVITLFNRRGGSGDNLTNTNFNDEATPTIASGLAPFAGSFKPEQSLTAVDNKSVNGTWTLRVRDDFQFDIGILRTWSLDVTGTQGNGGQSVQALGFLDEPVASAEDADLIAEPITVDSADSDLGSTTESRAADPAPTDSGDGVFMWQGADGSRSEYETAPVESTDFVERENRPALPATDSQAPVDAAVATLYFAPEGSADSEGEEDIFEAFPVD